MTSSIAINVEVNGRQVQGTVEPRELLVHFIRERCHLTGTHVGCDTTQCGACVVELGGVPIKSCTVLAVQVDGQRITTIEGIGAVDALHPLQAAFQQKHALQCGFCTPGMVMSLKALLATNASPTADEVRRWLDGNICRCTGYHNIVEAALHAAKLMREQALAEVK